MDCQPNDPLDHRCLDSGVSVTLEPIRTKSVNGDEEDVRTLTGRLGASEKEQRHETEKGYDFHSGVPGPVHTPLCTR